MKQRRGKEANRANGPLQKRSRSTTRAIVGTVAVIAFAMFAFVTFRTNRRAEATAFAKAAPPVDVSALLNPPAPALPPVAEPQAPVTSQPVTAPSPVATTTAPQSAPSQTPARVPPDPNASVKRISVADLRAAIDRGDVLVVDVRDAGTYAESHIKGSVNVPLALIDKEMASLPRDKTIVTYCTWGAEQQSARAALLMEDNGITDVAALLGGYGAWTAAGMPVETKKTE